MRNIITVLTLSVFSLSAVAQDTTDYPVAVSSTQVSNRADKGITGMVFTTDGHDAQRVYPAGGTNYIYRNMTSTTVNAKPGGQMNVSIQFPSKYVGYLWMNSYIYIDKDNDGQFDVDLSAITKNTPQPNGDLMTYSYIETEENVKGFTMEGVELTGDNRDVLQAPTFTIPADLAAGRYRMRVKMDWGSADPAGRMTATNSIVQNGGQIIDLTLNLHNDEITLQHSGEGGTVAFADGTPVNGAKVPYATALSVKQQPTAEGAANALTIRYGYNLTGDAIVHGNRQWNEVSLPASAADENGLFSISAAYTTGDIMFITHFDQAKGDYPLNFDPNQLRVSKRDRIVSAVTLSTDEGEATATGWNTAGFFYVYADATDQVLPFKAGETLTPRATTTDSSWMYAYLYIDYNQDGYFDVDGIELVTQTTDGSSYSSIPSFTLPSWLPNGDYRARFKTDWDCNDPGGRYGDKYTKDFINNNRGQIIDFTLRIDDGLAPASLREETEHCNLYTIGDEQLPTKIRGLESITFKVVPMQGYVLNGTLDVVSDAGTVSFTEIPDDGVLTAHISGNALIQAHFKEGPTATWHCIFNDEFNLDNYNWNDDDWAPQAANKGVTWARFNSQDKADGVCVQNNGYMSLTSKTTGTNTMVTGNLKTQYKHDFTYGRVEARCKVYPHTGNFPAFWMMPTGNKPNYSGTGSWGGWPNSGEIDIMEQINWENKAYQTIHTHWANGAGDGGLGNTYQKGGSCYVDMYDKWHIYAVEWDKEQLRWYVDGRHVHTYDRQPEHDNDNDRQWPYDRPFYVIINQSVGNGGWAANPDFSHTYRMDVDYVRVYQVKDPDAVTSVVANESLQINTGNRRIVVTAPAATRLVVSDISGRIHFNSEVSGTQAIDLNPGIYIAAGRKIIIK